MNFQISALDIGEFAPLFQQDQETLSKKGVLRLTADSSPGYPCRVSLQDADVGEQVLLLNYQHQSARTPFRSSHAIYIREQATQARPGRNEVPDMFRRLLSVRAFDAAGMIVEADVVDGDQLELLIERMFANETASYLHVHNARLGCYLGLVKRA